MRSRDLARLAWAGAAVLALAVLVVHARSYLPFLSDDALISLRYVRRFLDGHGLTWNDGERVEGYSNLLWVLAVSLLGLLRIDLVVATRVLGFAGMAAVLAAIFHRYRATDGRGVLPGFLAGMAVALSGSIAIWTVGGLEQPLLAGLLAWTLALVPHAARNEQSLTSRLPSILLACIALTRPDGLLFAVGIGAGLWLGHGRAGLRSAVRLAAVPLVAVLAQEIFRFLYYGDLLPNPAYAKLGMSATRFAHGAAYAVSGAARLAPIMLVAAVGIALSWRDRTRRARILGLGVPLVLWLTYGIAIGGDLFPGRRLLVPVVVLLAFLAGEGVEAAAIRIRPGARAGLWVGVAGLLAAFLLLQQGDPQNRRAREERWEWDGAEIGRMLGAAFGKRAPLLAVGAAGCLPYYSGLPSLDLYGLSDRHIAHHRPSDFGAGSLGHELGDGKYVLDRKPDLVIFGLPYGSNRGVGRSGQQMDEDPRFRRNYCLTAWETPGARPVRSLIWIRRDSERIGISRNGLRVEIPGYLICDNPSSVAGVDDRGSPGITITEEAPAGLDRIELSAGRWRLAVEASGADVDLMARRIGDPAEPVVGPSGVAIDLPRPGAIEVALVPRGAAAHVRRLVLTNEAGL